MHSSIKKICLIIGFICSPITHASNIVFDLGNVLITIDYAASLKTLNLWNSHIFGYIAMGNNPCTLRKKFFTFLKQIEPQNSHVVRDEKGAPVPQCMYNWLTGALSPDTIRTKIHRALDQAIYLHDYEREFFASLATIIFTPEVFVTTQRLMPEGYAFVQQCKAAGHKLYILSNWCGHSYELMQHNPAYQELFDLFDGILISGKIGSAKPEKEIYERLIATYNLNPADTVVIDDQPENVAMAQKMGMFGIICPQKRTLTAPWQQTPDLAAIKQHFATWYAFSRPNNA